MDWSQWVFSKVRKYFQKGLISLRLGFMFDLVNFTGLTNESSVMKLFLTKARSNRFAVFLKYISPVWLQQLFKKILWLKSHQSCNYGPKWETNQRHSPKLFSTTLITVTLWKTSCVGFTTLSTRLVSQKQKLPEKAL